ncbi:MAG TPA: gluconokinase [Chthoniobacterales bacterium]|jgi:gluconokinase|nr:gluconokinase [Chthoniobacterales bacterium]
MVVIIFGVGGVGKTTIGELLAQELGWTFYDADDVHPSANVEKMKRGEPLTDEDRQPWLESLREMIVRSLARSENAVLACSALKRIYRDVLRVSPEVKFVFLRGDRARIAEQFKQRGGHFFDPKLLEAQFADLEEPQPDEDALTVEIGREPPRIVDVIEASLRDSSP